MKKKKKPLSQFLKFSNIAIQMGVIIGLGTFAGSRLDLWLEKENLFTVLLSLLGVFGALYHVINEVIKLSK
tara:strand:- start:751 stop:963 length:213 start_codon:yes stop_codon:yes gene_type:complete